MGTPIADPVWREKVAKAARAAHEQIIEPCRRLARIHGYAICVHGSIARDIDYVAVPWQPYPNAAELLVEDMRWTAERILGWAQLQACTERRPVPELKPHGRKAWSIIIGGGTYIDLSVMPPAA